LNPKKWSKKQILGHLVDSGINNLQRFTEIQFEEKPEIKTRKSQEPKPL
jgi:ribosome biogenesis SPOUT family RNA methylase Rps3